MTKGLPKPVTDKADTYLAYADIQVGVAGSYFLKSAAKGKYTLCFVWDNSEGEVSDIEVVLYEDGKPASFKVDGLTFSTFAKAFSQAYGDEV